MLCSLFLVFYIFYQKTAYAMRISDWSSDVCSSDLHRGDEAHQLRRQQHAHGEHEHPHEAVRILFAPVGRRRETGQLDVAPRQPGVVQRDRQPDQHQHRPHRRGEVVARSEEHTSELQSLMRISYAVFCLKKKTTKKTSCKTE